MKELVNTMTIINIIHHIINLKEKNFKKGEK